MLESAGESLVRKITFRIIVVLCLYALTLFFCASGRISGFGIFLLNGAIQIYVPFGEDVNILRMPQRLRVDWNPISLSTALIDFEWAIPKFAYRPATGAVLSVPTWLVIGCLLIVGYLLKYRRRSVSVSGLCPKCSYDLRGSPTNRCSECGAIVEDLRAGVNNHDLVG